MWSIKAEFTEFYQACNFETPNFASCRPVAALDSEFVAYLFAWDEDYVARKAWVVRTEAAVLVDADS